MNSKRYNSYITVITFLIVLRVILAFTVGINFFSLGLIFDIFLVMFWVGAFAIFMKKATTQKIFYSIVAVIGSIITIGDSIYYGYFETIFSRKSFQGATNLTEGTTLEYDINIPPVVFVVVILLGICLYLIISNKKKDIFYLRDFGFLSMVFVVQVILFISWGHSSYDTKIEYYRSDAYLFESMYDRILYSEKYGYYNYHALDFTKIRTKFKVEEVKPEVDAFYEGRDKHEINDYSDQYKDYNLVTILVESLDTRFIDEVMTPNLYHMQQNGITFENYFSPVFQQGATCNSEFMSLNGLMSITTNDWSNNICDAYSLNYFPYSLPSQLRKQGYETYYFHSGHEWFYKREEMIPSYGFEHVKFQEDLQEDGYENYSERLDSDMITFIDEYVDFDKTFYVNMLSYSMHGAYNQVIFDELHGDRIEAAYPNNEFDLAVVNYMEKIVEFDQLLGKIITKLEDEGVMDNTLIAIYPDHYPYMMDHDIYSEYVGIEQDNHEIMRQDLIIYANDMTGTVISTPGSTMDITPTLLNLLNSNSNFDYFMGNDLLGNQVNYVMFSDLTVTDGENFLYINEELMGDSITYPALELALEDEITAFEILKKLLEIDYFTLIEE